MRPERRKTALAGGLRKGRGSSTALLHQKRPHSRPPGWGRRAHPALLPPLPRTRGPAFSAQRCTHLRIRAYGHRAPAATRGDTETPSPPGRLERPGSGWGKAERRGPAGGGALPAGGGGSGSAREWRSGFAGEWRSGLRGCRAGPGAELLVRSLPWAPETELVSSQPPSEPGGGFPPRKDQPSRSLRQEGAGLRPGCFLFFLVFAFLPQTWPPALETLSKQASPLTRAVPLLRAAHGPAPAPTKEGSAWVTNCPPPLSAGCAPPCPPLTQDPSPFPLAPQDLIQSFLGPEHLCPEYISDSRSAPHTRPCTLLATAEETWFLTSSS